MNNNITIVCCYNDKKQYGRLVRSLSGQTCSCELIGIDNCRQKFSSAAAALNSVSADITTEYVIYSHQDIELPEPDILNKLTVYLNRLKSGDIIGAAGAVPNPLKRSLDLEYVASYVRHGTSLAVAGEKEFSGMIPCDTVDECFFGGRTKTFLQAPFDETLCNGWHLYAVERCLYARADGHHVYVCDLPLLHYSGGTIEHNYNLNFYRLAKHYAGCGTRCIRTVCGSTKTDFCHRILFYLKRELLFQLHRL